MIQNEPLTGERINFASWLGERQRWSSSRPWLRTLLVEWNVSVYFTTKFRRELPFTLSSPSIWKIKILSTEICTTIIQTYRFRYKWMNRSKYRVSRTVTEIARSTVEEMKDRFRCHCILMDWLACKMTKSKSTCCKFCSNTTGILAYLTHECKHLKTCSCIFTVFPLPSPLQAPDAHKKRHSIFFRTMH